MRIVPVLLAVSAVAATAVASSPAGAQASKTAYVHVTARDSSGAPVAAAELTVTQGLKNVVAHTTTDDNGRGLMTVEVKDSSEFQLAMRKIGYRRGDRVFEVGPKDTATIVIVVPRPIANALATVTVTAKRDDRYNSYDLDADEIEASDRFMDNGWEVVKALRPVMLTSRGCDIGAQEIWVNGKRIRLPLRPTGMAAARAMVNVPARTRVSYVPVSVLWDIAPEHIQEIHYKDCFDHSMAAVGSVNAIFVTLKPGVMYVQNVGSFVMDAATAQKEERRKAP